MDSVKYTISICIVFLRVTSSWSSKRLKALRKTQDDLTIVKKAVVFLNLCSSSAQVVRFALGILYYWHETGLRIFFLREKWSESWRDEMRRRRRKKIKEQSKGNFFFLFKILWVKTVSWLVTHTHTRLKNLTLVVFVVLLLSCSSAKLICNCNVSKYKFAKFAYKHIRHA